MKHNIRQRQLDKNGLMTTKIVKVDGELGSSWFDKNDKEVFEGDFVKNRYGEIEAVKFSGATFMLDKCKRDLCEFNDTELEVVGHAED